MDASLLKSVRGVVQLQNPNGNRFSKGLCLHADTIITKDPIHRILNAREKDLKIDAIKRINLAWLLATAFFIFFGKALN